MTKKDRPDPVPYGDAREELDGILRKLEEGEVDVDQLAEKVERASTLISLCKKRLQQQETRVRKITEELAAQEEEEGSEEE